MPRCSDAQAQIRWGRCHWGSCCSLCTVMGRGWEEKRISVWFGLNTVLKGFIGVTRSGKSDFDMVWKLFRGSSLVLFSAENFSVARSKCCFTGCSTLPRTHFWGKTGRNLLLCHIACQSERGKELVSSLHGAFKKKIRPLWRLFPFITTFCRWFVRIYVVSFIITLSSSHVCEWTEKRQDGNQKLSLANRPLYFHLTWFHSHRHYPCFFPLSHSQLNVFLNAFFPPFIRYCWDFSLILLVTVCTEKGKTLGWREGGKKDNSLI